MGLQFDIRILGLDRLSGRMARASGEARHAVVVQAAKDTEPYVPALTKSMANRVHPQQKRLTDATEIDGDTIIYPGPYARYLYHGKLMVDPNTGSAWARYGGTKVVTGKALHYNHSVHSKAQDHWFEASKAQNKEKWIRVAERAVRHEFG